MSERIQPRHRNMGGETPGRREAMDRMQKQLIHGGNSPEKARQIVTEQAKRADREGR